MCLCIHKSPVLNTQDGAKTQGQGLGWCSHWSFIQDCFKLWLYFTLLDLLIQQMRALLSVYSALLKQIAQDSSGVSRNKIKD